MKKTFGLFRWIIVFNMQFSSALGWGASAEDDALLKEIQALRDKVQSLEAQVQSQNQKLDTLDSASNPAEQATIQELDQQVKAIQRQRELEQEAAAEKAKTAPVVTAGKDGFAIKSADGAHQLKLRGYIHADSRWFLDDDDSLGSDTFVMRRVRPIFEGTLFDHFDFRLMPDFGSGSTTLQDAYIDINYWPEAKLRFGKFKPPVGLERLQSATALNFVERGLPTLLVPNRDVGVQLFGDLGGETFSYALGVFNGVRDGGSADLDVGDGKDFAARLFTHPFKNSEHEYLQGLGFGVSGTYGDSEEGLPSYRSAGQNRFFTYAADATPDGNQYRISPQGYYYYGPFGLLGEYVLSSQEVKRGGATNRFENDARQIQATYVLTGEDASYKGVKPKKPFSWKDGSWGAWEIAARYGALNVDGDVFGLAYADATRSADQTEEWGVGVNWYLNNNAKVMTDFVQTTYSNGKAGGDREDENAVLTRLQISF